jgi:hypothetical protein
MLRSRSPAFASTPCSSQLSTDCKDLLPLFGLATPVPRAGFCFKSEPESTITTIRCRWSGQFFPIEVHRSLLYTRTQLSVGCSGDVFKTHQNFFSLHSFTVRATVCLSLFIIVCRPLYASSVNRLAPTDAIQDIIVHRDTGTFRLPDERLDFSQNTEYLAHENQILATALNREIKLRKDLESQVARNTVTLHRQEQQIQTTRQWVQAVARRVADEN